MCWICYFGIRPRPLKKLQTKTIPTKFTIAIFGDCQGADNPFTSLRPTYFVFNRIVKDIQRTMPLFTVVLGDIVSSGRWHHVRRFAQQLSFFKTPVYLTIGNHDIKYNGRHWFNRFFGQTYYFFQAGRYAFIFLDNADGTIGAEQWQWLQRTLSQHHDNHIFIFTHQPFFDPRPGYCYAMSDQEKAKELIDLCTRYKVKAVFSSHLHGYYTSLRNNVHYYISGGAGSRLTSDKDFYHYLLLHVEDDSFSVETVPVPAHPSFIHLLPWISVFAGFIVVLAFTF